jgi:hypothetical protein
MLYRVVNIVNNSYIVGNEEYALNIPVASNIRIILHHSFDKNTKKFN